MSPEENNDSKRNKIIGLLYIVFICFSVISIKVSLLDSNIFTIHSFEGVFDENNKKIAISENVILDNIDQLTNIPKAKSYLKISNRIEKSLSLVSQMIDSLNYELEQKNTSILKQFNNRTTVESILKKDTFIPLLNSDLFELKDFVFSSKHQLDSIQDPLFKNIPLQNNIKTIKGKDSEWEEYLFYKKPTAISYMQLVRIKVLLAKSKLLYNEAALKEINYSATYFSPFNPKLYVLKSEVKYYDEDEILKDGEKAISENTQVVDDLFKSVLQSLNTENIFAGIPYTLLSDFNYEVDSDFAIEISPTVKTSLKNDQYVTVFTKPGTYSLKFYDKRLGSKLLFERDLKVGYIPDPIVRIAGKGFENYIIDKDELLQAERLEGVLKINYLSSFPGRINTFKISRIHNGKEVETVINYGEIFQSPAQNIIAQLEVNDFLVINLINVTMDDGTTRVLTPLTFRILKEDS
jgi:hypothetical protein